MHLGAIDSRFPSKHSYNYDMNNTWILFCFIQDFLSEPDMIAVLEKFFQDIKSDDRTLPVVKEIVGSLEK